MIKMHCLHWMVLIMFGISGDLCSGFCHPQANVKCKPRVVAIGRSEMHAHTESLIMVHGGSMVGGFES